jgi:hypothetical protein
MRRRTARLLGASAAAIAVAVGACGINDFDSPTKLESVRVLGTRAAFDEAYARPGDSVTLETLAVDGRTSPTTPLTTYWIPYVCQDPKNDLYAACFTAPSEGGDGGAGDGGGGAGAFGGGAGALLQPGTDLTPFLPTGPRYTFQVPKGLPIKTVPGITTPYGLVMVFNIACAGHVQVTAFNPSTGQQQVPLGCFDDAGNALGANDYVIGFTRVYVHGDPDHPNPDPNQNPAIAGVVVQGQEIATQADPSRPPGDAHDVPAPVHLTFAACNHTCKASTIDLDVPIASWESNPDDVDPTGAQRHEAIWVDYYATGGSIDGEARLLYDSTAGRLSSTETKYTPPDDPGDAKVYAVVHDNRDGVTWIELDVHAQ